MKKRTMSTLFSILAVTLLITPGLTEKPSQNVQETMKALGEQISATSPCKLVKGMYEFGGKGYAGSQTTFRGLIQSRSLSPLGITITTGYRERYNVQKGGDLWTVKTIREATLEGGQDRLEFRLAVLNPPSVKESLKREFLLPVIEVKATQSGEILDATVASPRYPDRVVQQFDPEVLSGPFHQKVSGYEIIWSATLSSPGKRGPAVFTGKILNLQKKEETILLRVGFFNKLGGTPLDQGWTWYAEKEIPVSADNAEVPFSLKVNCPQGVYVGIANQVYEGKAWIWTQAQQEAKRLAYENAKRAQIIPAKQIVTAPEIAGVTITNATFAFTHPGKKNNGGHFEFSVRGTNPNVSKVLVKYGFLTSVPAEPMNSRTWHFTHDREIEVKSGSFQKIQDDVDCHIFMDSLVEVGRYKPYILVLPVKNP